MPGPKPLPDILTPAPLTERRILARFRANEWHRYYQDADGDYGIFDSNDPIFFKISGARLTTSARWHATLPPDRLDTVARILNLSNARAFAPTAYPVLTPYNRIQVYADTTAEYPHGVSDPQLQQHFRLALAFTQQLFSQLLYDLGFAPQHNFDARETSWWLKKGEPPALPAVNLARVKARLQALGLPGEDAGPGQLRVDSEGDRFLVSCEGRAEEIVRITLERDLTGSPDAPDQRTIEEVNRHSSWPRVCTLVDANGNIKLRGGLLVDWEAGAEDNQLDHQLTRAFEQLPPTLDTAAPKTSR